MALFVPLDVDFQSDPKIIEAGYIGECLYNRSLALAKRTMKDGVIYRPQLAQLCLGLPGKAAKHADTLVAAGLWISHPDGWLIASWLKRNQSADHINEKVARKKAAAQAANHARWHEGADGKPSPNCPLCYPTGVRTGSDTESTEEESQEETESEEESQQQQSAGSDIDQRAAAAVEIAIKHRIALPGVTNPPGLRIHLQSILPAQAMAYLAQFPDAPTELIAWRALDGPPPPLQLVHTVDPDIPPCLECLDTPGWVQHPELENTSMHCPACSPSTSASGGMS
jgi:hypothetical protein